MAKKNKNKEQDVAVVDETAVKEQEEIVQQLRRQLNEATKSLKQARGDTVLSDERKSELDALWAQHCEADLETGDPPQPAKSTFIRYCVTNGFKGNELAEYLDVHPSSVYAAKKRAG